MQEIKMSTKTKSYGFEPFVHQF